MNIFDKIPVREKIKLLRVSNGITQEELAEKLNVSRSAIAKWETDNGTQEEAAFDKKGFRKPNTLKTTPKTKIGLPQLR